MNIRYYIRYYRKEDLFGVNRLLKENFSIEKTKDNIDDNHIEIVTTSDDIIVGYMLITFMRDFVTNDVICFFDYVCVLKNYRNNGIAKSMLNMAIDLAKAREAKYIQLTSSWFRNEARKLYQDMGFTIRDSDIFRKELV